MGTISKKQFKELVEAFDFTRLFNRLGWNYIDEHTPIKLKDETYMFHSVAEKGGFRILVYKPTQQQNLPDYATRLQLDRKIGKLYREHLIVFCDNSHSTQIWQLLVRQLGKPSRLSETRWNSGQEPELLYQKTSNLFFTLDQEDNITISDVVDKVNENFSKNVEQVTKKFYENFRKEHKKFIEFIEGISIVADREWYASLMLNRLMFCYFIQRKGFLDNNLNYLKDKLTYCQHKKGKDKFYVSFYKNFLLALFHQGLGAPNQTEELKNEIGRIPYLNGGLFDVHELEKQYLHIDISDKAFENIFHFFDQYHWHLDTRMDATGKDINPDVIGYIFEKYINDRAQMGAYYTKEDITDYISKNCIIPFLFDETFRSLRLRSGNDRLSEVEVWQLVKQSDDAYIYDAVKKSVTLPLPNEIEIGVDTSQPNLIERRKAWNTTAPVEYALPTEIWREVVDRRNRYTEVKSKIEKGEIAHINDFITYNLNIRQFAQDVVENTNDPELLKHFYKALSSITIIDPTCGSGAFLFAAMNILEPLYESCLQRMENFVAEAPKGKYKFFEETLAQVKRPEHPNLQYFIYKSIILRNLYGVDIMKEAVEIAKLRLFLKLVATVEADYRKPNLGLEPLPDIDFNIRAGNTLVGFATEAELQKGLTYTLDGALAKPAIEEKCEVVANAFKRYKDIQLTYSDDFKEFKEAKEELNKRLIELNHQLNQLLHKQAEAIPYDTWLQTHQPFHWFAEFYEIVQGNGGFDVIIGNPPYVPLKDVKYIPKNYDTLPCGDIYALCIERSINSLLRKESRIGMIVPISIVSTNGYSTLRKVCQNSGSGYFFSNFGVRPSKLFDGVDKRLTIFIKNNETVDKIYTTKYYRWVSGERDNLFSKICYQNVNKDYFTISGYPKISNDVEQSILEALNKQRKSVGNFLVKNSNHKIRYTRKLQYFIQFFENVPIIYDCQRNILEPSELKDISVNSEIEKNTLLAVLNSGLFFWFFIAFSDCRNVNTREILKMPCDLSNMDNDIKNELSKLANKLMIDLENNSIFLKRNDKRAGLLEIQSFQPRESKPIIDEIDAVLAEHYGFTEEELDFIINYDIKYRMGKELEGGEEE